MSTAAAPLRPHASLISEANAAGVTVQFVSESPQAPEVHGGEVAVEGARLVASDEAATCATAEQRRSHQVRGHQHQWQWMAMVRLAYHR
jgi:hypothetical protein